MVDLQSLVYIDFQLFVLFVNKEDVVIIVTFKALAVDKTKRLLVHNLPCSDEQVTIPGVTRQNTRVSVS